MERLHPRDILSPVARAAMATTTTTTATSSDGLLRRGVRMARSMLINPRCVDSEEVNTCEKPSMSTNETLGIMAAAGVVVFLLALCGLYVLHLRRNRQEANEFVNDHHNNADYGLDDIPGQKGDYLQQPAPTRQYRMSGQQLREAQNPFGNGAELADSDKVAATDKATASDQVSASDENPPKYPDAVKM